MKGKLHKTEQGWVVRYTQEDPRDPLPELLLHPEYQTILPLDLDLEGKEVEFDWCVIVDHDSGKGKEYAKLLDKKEKISDRKSYIAKRLVKEMPKHIADMVDTYAEKIDYLEKFIIDETLKENESWEGCDGCDETDEYFWKKGFQAGYNKATPTEISDEVDYKKLYFELYDNVAKLLVENREKNYTPATLLNKWDNIRK